MRGKVHAGELWLILTHLHDSIHNAAWSAEPLLLAIVAVARLRDLNATFTLLQT